MQKTSLLVIVLLVILLVVGGIFYWWYQRDTGTVNANVTEINVTVNGAPVNASITQENWVPEETGDIAVDETATHKDVTFALTTASKPTEFHGETAEEGKQFVVVYFRDIPLALRDGVTTWVRSDVKLVDTDGATYAIELYGLITEYSEPTETGYFQFTTPKTASGFSLRFGEGDSATTTSLGF